MQKRQETDNEAKRGKRTIMKNWEVINNARKREIENNGKKINTQQF